MSKKLYVRNQKEFKSLVSPEEYKEELEFYKKLLKEDPEAAQFYYDFFMESYSKNPTTDWGRDRRNARRKDIAADGFKSSTNPQEALESQNSTTSYSSTTKRKRNNPYNEYDYLKHRDTSPEIQYIATETVLAKQAIRGLIDTLNLLLYPLRINIKL